MVKFKVQRKIEVTVDKAWETISDFSNVWLIHPLIDRSSKDSENDRGINAIRTCNLITGKQIQEKVIEWLDDSMSYTMEILKSNLPLRKSTVNISVVKANDDGTSAYLIADCDVIANVPVLAFLVERIWIKPRLAKHFGDLFAGLEEHVSSGHAVPRTFRPETKPNVTLTST